MTKKNTRALDKTHGRYCGIIIYYILFVLYSNGLKSKRSLNCAVQYKKKPKN